MKLTDQQKEDKRKRDTLNSLCNSILSAYNFKKINSWSDVYKFTSIPKDHKHLDIKPTYAEVKEYVDSLRTQAFLKFQNETFNLKITKIGNVEAPVSPVKETVTPITEPKPKEREDGEHNDYGLMPSKKEHPELIRYWFQRKASKLLLDNILIHDKRGQQLIADAGYGKTFIIGAVACRLAELGFANGKAFGMTQYLYVTKNSVTEQAKRVYEKMFQLTLRDKFEVINYEQLRAKAGQFWVQEYSEIIGGEEKFVWKWRPMLNPVVIIWDESHSLKNQGSVQHNIGLQVNNIQSPVYQIFVSATPYTRVSEAKCFAISTGHDISHITGIPGTKLNISNWPTFCDYICGPKSAPEDYNEAAVDRLTKELEPYIVRVKGVRPQFTAKNRVKKINFKTKEEKAYYDDTEARYYREKAKLDAAVDAGGITGAGIHHLTLLTKRAVAAEFCRKDHFAEDMYNNVQNGYAACCAVKYKTTLIPIVKTLNEKYGVSRDMISLIWGGGQTQLTKKQKSKAQIKEKASELEKMGLNTDDLMKNLDLEDVEDRVLEELPEELRLGPQSKEERQKEIDRFQSGKTLYCIYTFKAGGVGLSLHHTDELTKHWLEDKEGFKEWFDSLKNRPLRDRPSGPGKVGRKASGYAYEEDVLFIPTRQRKTVSSVAYSGIDMVQAAGRVPRINSLSETEQDFLLYNGTVEDDIAVIYNSKLRCLAKCTRGAQASWLDLISKTDRHRIIEELTAGDSAEDDGETVGVNEEED